MLESFFQWMSDSSMSTFINGSNWLYAVIQAFHLVALAVFFGAVLVVDLRLLGRGFTQQPLAQVARDAQPWFIWALIALILTGIPQLVSGATKEYNSPLFWRKMDFLLAAIVFSFTIRRKVVMTPESRVGHFWEVGLISIVLWLGVAIPARLIGLF